MAKEIWKTVKNFEGLYEVSNLGRVRSLDRTTIDKNGREIFYKGKFLKPLNTRGYLAVIFTKDGKARRFTIHRLVAMAFLPNPLNLPQVNHIDCKKNNNIVSNLEWVTPKENMQHAYEHELIKVKKGAESHHSKLTQIQANKIRQLYSAGCYSMLDLAKKHLVSSSTIYRIINHKTYKSE